MTASTPSRRDRLTEAIQIWEDRLRLMDTARDTKAKVEHGDSDFPKSLPKMEDVQGQILMEKHGVPEIADFFKTKLGRWKDVEINIGITGGSGVGKSSFINAIRRLRDYDDGAAKTGVTEAANVVTVYHHPTNNKIKFWDLSSIGTPDYSAKTYSDKVGLEKYDTFLILADVRFTENDLLLAETVKSMKKSFFLVRTKIDQDVQNEKRKKAFNQEATLNDIRKDCLKSFGANEEVVFLISNHHPAKWDFARLTQAILDVLPHDQKESLTLTIDVLTSHSKDILNRKVEMLRGRIWMVAAASAAAAVIPLPGLSIAVDLGLLTYEVNFYKSQFGLPKETSDEFQKMFKEDQEIITLKFYFTNVAELANIFTLFAVTSAVEETVHFIPFVGSAIAGSISFSSTYNFLSRCLNELEKTASNLLDETNTKVAPEDEAARNTEIKWIERSKKHPSKLSEFVAFLKTNPSKATRIGVYRVCFDDKFSIGQGSDGTKIYVGLSDDGFEVAIKSMILEKCVQMGDIEKNILNFPEVRNEKHIVNYRFHELFDSTKAYLVLDLLEENLRDYVLNKERSLEQLRKEGPRIIRQILYGVSTLHCSDPEVLHRDLKPSNILVSVEGEMVLADFGISRLLPKEATTYKSGVSGTEGWMAVESLPNEDDDDDYLSHEVIQVRYKKQSDIQVVGMLCYYVLTKGKHPYGKRVHRTSNISQGNFDLKELSDDSDSCARDLITWMLQHDPAKRPDVHQCLKHPYLRTAEENFNLVVSVGNEKEIKTRNATSIVVQELNKLPVFINWISMIEACVMNYMTAHRCPYRNDAADLLRFVRNTSVHWHDKTPPASVQNTVVTPQEYFERKFPTLPVELHRIIRRNSDWSTREHLMEYF